MHGVALTHTFDFPSWSTDTPRSTGRPVDVTGGEERSSSVIISKSAMLLRDFVNGDTATKK